MQPCDEPDWEGIQLKRTSKNTLGKQAPLPHNLEDGAAMNLLMLRLQLMKRTWNCSRRSRVFLLLPTGQVNSTGETAEAQVVEIFFVISVSLYSFQSCTKSSNDGYYVTILFIYNP